MYIPESCIHYLPEHLKAEVRPSNGEEEGCIYIGTKIGNQSIFCVSGDGGSDCIISAPALATTWVSILQKNYDQVNEEVVRQLGFQTVERVYEGVSCKTLEDAMEDTGIFKTKAGSHEARLELYDNFFIDPQHLK